jgi:hypothetical protein
LQSWGRSGALTILLSYYGRALDENRCSRALVPLVEQLIECARQLGPSIHVETDYGDEATWRTPWELFDEAAAESALALAVEALALARQIVAGQP